MWARIEDGYWGCDVLRASRGSSARVVPPIRFDEVRRIDDASSTNVARAWAVHFAKALVASECTPLADGLWQLGALELGDHPEIPSDKAADILEQPPVTYVSWDCGSPPYALPLREASPPDDGRVHAWRKVAREGRLPPVLLTWVSALQTRLVLDGHDRLRAAQLQGTPAPVIHLHRITEQEEDEAVRRRLLEALEQPMSEGRIDASAANRVLLASYMPRIVGQLTRAFPLPGGIRTWRREVTEHVERADLDGEDLLRGLDSIDGDELRREDRTRDDPAFAHR